ncbi:RNA-directed DNA polymerase from mobile element jockey-like [Elysia marginata]|uniref:RNA-directed DNA polymerase from mobile element jockey-like n=1 Tax=Elysia marginata TaxID=1093978 RepID=A0AAV4EU75_9GAST|nr:RNA-directed DNA polymerase from mobile element jockey-like [Elysia marginata]
MCNEAKEEWINGQCKEIKDCKKADNAYMHQKINDIASKKRTARGGCIKSKDGKILMETSDILERWSEYMQELFYDERGQQAIFNWGIDQVTKLLNRIYDTGNIPKDMLISTFVTLQKKPRATECENHRTISLMSHTLKLLLKIVLTTIRSKIKPEISETQFGFVANKGTTNAIFTMMMLMERCIEIQKDLYLIFIDYFKAFDKVRHEELFYILDSLMAKILEY